MKRAIKGISVLEMVLVLAAILGLIAVAARNYNQVATEQLALNAVRQVRVLTQTIHTRFDESASYAGLGPKLLVQIMPGGALLYDDNIDAFVSPWGAPMRVEPYAFAGVSNAGYAIDIERASPAACASMVTALAREFSEIDVGGEVIKKPSAGLGYQPPLEEITAVCAPGRSGREPPVVSFRGA